MNWTVGRAFLDLINQHSYSYTGALTEKAVINTVQERTPQSAQMLAVTKDNAAPA